MSADQTSAKLGAAAAPAAANMTPTGTQSLSVLAARRFVFGVVNVLTAGALLWWMVTILAGDGFGLLDLFIVATFAIYLPWVTVGFWNSIVGFAVLHFFSNPIRSVIPMLDRARPDDPIVVGVAVTMTVRNEDPSRAFLRLRTMKASLDATGYGDRFDYFILSDSTEPEVIAAEEAEYKKWKREVPQEGRIVYRRRTENTGFKAGNVRDFIDRWGANYDVMVPLDADSVMTGEAVVRLVRVMQANPRLGILQSLVVGMPSPSFFARVFQFGMRHAMRSYTAGTVWWHADCGPFWGHNAAIRVAAFKEHCKLPTLPGKPPFGGHILSHDQIEAILMRRAGYEVRVLPDEDGSWEEMPPALPDFAVRDLRWCQGNLQYLKLVHLPRLPMSRFNILFALQMFIGVAAFVIFVVLAAVAAIRWPEDAPFATGSALGLYLLFFVMFSTPKIAGIADAMLRSPELYGGRGKLLAGGIFEALFNIPLTAISMVSQTMFMIALLFGQKIGWNAQRRDRYRLQWAEAIRVFWPQTLFGLAIFLLLAWGNPGAIVWFLPFIGGLILSVPFAVYTASPELGAAAARARFCAIPEEFVMPAELAKIMPRAKT